MAITALPIPTESDLAHLEQCDSGVRVRRLIERAIVRKLVSDILAAGHRISVDDGDDAEYFPVKRSTDADAIMDAAFSVDVCELHFIPSDRMGLFAWVKLVYGNDGWDVIGDHSTNIEELLKPTNDYAESLSAWC